MEKINYFFGVMCLFVLMTTSSCNFSWNPIPKQQEVTIKSFHYSIKDNIVNFTADCDTTLDGTIDIKNVPVAMPNDALRIIIGLKEDLNVNGVLVTYKDHSAIERVYIK